MPLRSYDAYRSLVADAGPSGGTARGNAMKLTAFLLLLLLCPAAFATAQPTPITDVPKYLDHQREVREDFRYSKKFKHVDNESKERLYKAQDEVFTLLEGRKSVDELSPDQLIALYNAQGTINAVLTDAELDREICKREKLLGSHRSSLVCMSVRDARRIKEEGKTMLMAPRVCDPKTGCGAGG